MDWIAKRAKLSSEKTALIDIDNKRTLTYGELDKSANNWAAFFHRKGVTKGDRIAVLAMNQAEIFEILFACAKVGAIMVPINWRLSVTDIHYILEDCAPTLLLYSRQFANLLESLQVNVAVPLTKDVHSVNQGKELEKGKGREDDPWLIIYTGGTTGKAKGVVLSHNSVDWNALNTIVSWGLTADEVTVTYMPLFHTGGINALSLPILMNGGTVVIGNKFDPKEALLNLVKYKSTIALFVPTMYHMMQQTDEFEQLHFPDMKVFLSGGAPCPLSVYERFAKKGYRFKEGYGLTEAGPNNFYISPEEAMVKRGSVGKAMLFNEVKIVREDGSEAGNQEVGELVLRGNHSFLSYWNNDEATNETWSGGWLHTGDLATRDDEGYYYIVGRKKDMMISGGENVYPLEIEQWLTEHEAINEAAVIGVSDELWGEKVTAFISFLPGYSLTEEELKQYCALKLAKYKIPKAFLVLEEIPKTAVGKIDKNALKNWVKIC